MSSSTTKPPMPPTTTTSTDNDNTNSTIDNAASSTGTPAAQEALNVVTTTMMPTTVAGSTSGGFTGIGGSTSATSPRSLQGQVTADSTVSATHGNPWNISPAVTASKSENSEDNKAATSSENPEETPEVAAAARMISMNVQRASSNPVPLPQQATPSLFVNPPPQPTQGGTATDGTQAAAAEAEIPQASSLPTSAMKHTTTIDAPPVPPSQHDGARVRFSASTAAPETTKTRHPNLTIQTSTDYQEGGRLWQAALEEVEKKEGNDSASKNNARNRIAESIMERTRSRADPNALISQPGTPNGMGKPCGTMVSLGGDTESSFILSTALAKKRVRVVQLLLIGLVGLLLGLLGNFFVSTSCHFASVKIVVGQNEQEFDFHFGLWKYSPIESVFQGYPYCYKYDQNYASEAPLIARAANITALLAGLISLSVLWLYLIFGNTNKHRWKWAVRMAIFAGVIQLGTMYFFFDTLCQEFSCHLGLGAYLSIFTSVVWFVLACEMQYHMPVAVYAANTGMAGPAAHLEEPHALVAQMEMTSCMDDVTREYVTRVTGKNKDDELPTLTELHEAQSSPRQRPRGGFSSPTTSDGCGFYIPSPRGTYQAPDPALLEEALQAPSSLRKEQQQQQQQQQQ